MRTYSVAFLSPLLFFLALPVQAVAQSAAPASVPDQMPFDITYGEPVTAAEAEAAVRRVVGEAMKAPRNWKLAVAVTDPGGELVYLYRLDQTQIGSDGGAVSADDGGFRPCAGSTRRRRGADAGRHAGRFARRLSDHAQRPDRRRHRLQRRAFIAGPCGVPRRRGPGRVRPAWAPSIRLCDQPRRLMRESNQRGKSSHS